MDDNTKAKESIKLIHKFLPDKVKLIATDVVETMTAATPNILVIAAQLRDIFTEYFNHGEPSKLSEAVLNVIVGINYDSPTCYKRAHKLCKEGIIELLSRSNDANIILELKTTLKKLHNY